MTGSDGFGGAGMTAVQTSHWLEPSASERRLWRARQGWTKVDASLLRAMVHNWRAVDHVELFNPAVVAEQVLQALDVVAIVYENEAEMMELDATLAKVFEAPPRGASRWPVASRTEGRSLCAVCGASLADGNLCSACVEEG